VLIQQAFFVPKKQRYPNTLNEKIFYWILKILFPSCLIFRKKIRQKKRLDGRFLHCRQAYL